MSAGNYAVPQLPRERARHGEAVALAALDTDVRSMDVMTQQILEAEADGAPIPMNLESSPNWWISCLRLNCLSRKNRANRAPGV